MPRLLIEKFRTALSIKAQIGLGIMYPASGVIERIGSDWDWLWIDGQHGSLDYRDLIAAVRACNLIGRPAVVRVPSNEFGAIGTALDTGAEGVMVPLVNSADEARKAVKAAKFPPLGERSYGGRRPIDLFGRSYAHQSVAQPLLICQIETSAALTDVKGIAAVEGVDAVFFGPDDMRLEARLPMDAPLPQDYFLKAKRAIADAALAHGIVAGSVFPSLELIKEGIGLGYRLVVATADAVLLANGSRKISEEIRSGLHIFC